MTSTNLKIQKHHEKTRTFQLISRLFHDQREIAKSWLSWIYIYIHKYIYVYIYIWTPIKYTPEIKQNYTSCFNSISALFLCPRYVCGRCCSGNRWPPGRWVPEPLREEWVAPLRSSAIHGFLLGIDDVGHVGCGHFMGYLLGYDYGMYFPNDNIYIYMYN